MAESNCEHQTITPAREGVQNKLRMSTERHAQGQEIQAARMDARG